jgi:hypothetical protein
MEAQQNRLDSASVQLYVLRPSRTVWLIELTLHAIVFLLVVAELQGGMLWLALTLFVALAWRYSSSAVSQHQLPPGSSLELNAIAQKLTWNDGNAPCQFGIEQSSVIMSRYLVLLRLGQGRRRLHKLLLADSFDDINRYTRFRRQIKEIYQC